MTLRGLLQAAAVVTGACSLVALAPVDHFAVQLFTNFRLQYLSGALILVVGLGLLREGRYALAMVAIAALNASFILPWYFDQPSTTGGPEFKVAVANLLSSNDDHEKLFGLVGVEQPDLLLLLEVSPSWEKALVRLDSDYPHRIVEPRAGNFGIALYSRLPFTSGVLVDGTPQGSPMVMASLELGGRTVHVIGAHPMIPLGTDNYETRNAQLDGIARLLQPMDGGKILLGDLNTSLWDTKYRSLENRTWLRNVRRGFGLLPTWPLFMPPAMIPIDHVLVSEDIGVAEVHTGSRIGSDHLPLVATLTL